MTAPNDLDRLHQGLHSARARLQGNYVDVAWERGAARASTTLLIAGIAAVVCGGVTRSGVISGTTAVFLPAVGVVFAAGQLLVAPIRQLFRRPTLEETAERLDAAAGNQNRTAVALDLVHRGLDTPFAIAAIRAGLTSLQTHELMLPQKPIGQRRWAGIGLRFSGAAAMLAIAAWIPIHSSVRVSGDIAIDNDIPRGVSSAVDGPSTLPSDPPRVNTPTTTASSTVSPAAQTTPLAATPGRTAAGSTSSGQGAGGASAGAPAGSPQAAAKPLADQAAAARPPSATPRRATIGALSSAGSGAASSAAAGGASGGRQKTAAVDSEWKTHEQIRSDESAGEDDRTVEPDAAPTGLHNGAMQPLLQDRQPSATRELGIGSPKDGPSGNGRGGPSVQKKSRGVGAMMMAVPQAEHVRGRLQAGTSRAGEVLAPPLTSPQSPAAAAPIAPPNAEPPVRPEPLPGDQADLLSRYFAALHREAAAPNLEEPKP